MEVETFVLLAIAILNAFSAYWAWRVKNDVIRLEQNTNSMKDALVLLTGESEHAKGVLQGKAEQKARTQKNPGG